MKVYRLPAEVGEGSCAATRGAVDQLIINYLKSDVKPEITKEYVFEIVEKHYPGTFKMLKIKLVNTITNEEKMIFNSTEIKVFNELKNNHLKRHRSDARYLSKSNIDIDTERELILNTKTNLE